ncbi:MAG TPA: FkbM family methyltransferase [Alphaproteobacteria bacterium]|nr:FkbM family methyltransferase [Alphaproteobacteria bacterium]
MTTALKQTAYGLMCFNPLDKWIGESLLHYGEYSQMETQRLVDLLPEGGVAVDVGANIGCITLALASKAKEVWAFEPQRLTFQKLCANLAINNFQNVVAKNVACGSVSENVGRLLQHDAVNNGAASMCVKEKGDEKPGEYVGVEALDKHIFEFNRLDLIKIDVEGYEDQVLCGARNIIEKFRPFLYVEADRDEKSPELIQLLQNMGYMPFWDITPLSIEYNFDHNRRDIFRGIVSINLLCVYKDKPWPASIPLGLLPEALPGDTFHIMKRRVNGIGAAA